MTDMTKPYDGGPAFPHQFQDAMGHPEWRQSTGMTLRDWFAGQALAGEMTVWGAGTEGHECNIARRAYALADAMLEARGK